MLIWSDVSHLGQPRTSMPKGKSDQHKEECFCRKRQSRWPSSVTCSSVKSKCWWALPCVSRLLKAFENTAPIGNPGDPLGSCGSRLWGTCLISGKQKKPQTKGTVTKNSLRTRKGEQGRQRGNCGKLETFIHKCQEKKKRRGRTLLQGAFVETKILRNSTKTREGLLCLGGKLDLGISNQRLAWDF